MRPPRSRSAPGYGVRIGIARRAFGLAACGGSDEPTVPALSTLDGAARPDRDRADLGRATRDARGKERSRFTNLIAEPAADQSAVAEAVNDMLKAISASLLMEQVLAPRYEFTPKDAGRREGFDYGEEGYRAGGHNVGVNRDTGQVHLEINGLAQPDTPEATRICREDLNEVVTSFLQDKVAVERGLFDKENTLPEELTQLRMGKIVRERYPELSEADQEAVRSLSAYPFVARHRELIHKIGVTGGKVAQRIAAADTDATYLLAGVEVAATYKLHNLSRVKLENVFHRLFGAAQLDLTIKDRFGQPVKPRDWFLVPLHVIDEAVRHICDGSIAGMAYDLDHARLVARTGAA